MKKTYIWMFAIFFVLQCCISGCTHLDNSSSGTLGGASTGTTYTSIVDEDTSTTTSTDQTTGNTIITSSITSTQTTSQEKICEGTVAHKEFKSVEELLGWIHNGKDYPADLFRGAIQSLKLDRILIIESADDTFTLEFVRTFQRGSSCDAQIEYYFISEKGERVGFYVKLKYMCAYVDDVEIYVDNPNLDNDDLNHFKDTYRDITMPTGDGSIS